ncbi:MAG: hypothetical protein KDE31_00335 [Caldilineaceae bacterium]|nr:hypothetical protein [Caldilineaceae bacterium]
MTASIHLGGIVRHAAHPKSGPLNGGPQMVEISRDGKRVYFSNSLYASWDAQFYPEGIRGWATVLNVNPEGGMTLDPHFFVEFGEERPHQNHDGRHGVAWHRSAGRGCPHVGHVCRDGRRRRCCV